MKAGSRFAPAPPGRAWLWSTTVLAGALGLGTWLLLSLLIPQRLPEDFPALPDLRSENPALREVLAGADAAARNRPASAETIGKLGMAYHANQFYEQAERAYGTAARLAPRDYRWPYCRALLREETGREQEVPEFLRETLRLEPDFIPALQKLGDIHFKQEKLDDAAGYYERSVRAHHNGPNLQGLFGLGRIAARRRDWSKVIECAAPLVRAYPPVRPPHQLLLAAYGALGQADRAEEERRVLLQTKLIAVPPAPDALNDELISLSRSSTRLLKEAGLLYRCGRPDDAIEVARRTAAIDPQDADARHFLARALIETRGGRPEAVDEALSQLAEGLRLRPDDRTPLWYFTSYFFEQPKADAAVEKLRALLERNADRGDAHYYLGLVADSQGRTQEAAAQYQAALKSDPGHAEAWHKLGLILVAAGRTDEGIAHFRKALGLNPAFTTARFNLGVALQQRGRTDQAMEQFVEALRLKPSDGPTHLYLAVALLKAGRLERAAEHFRESIRIAPGEAQAHYGLACVLSMKQKPDEAAVQLREAIRLRPDYLEALDLLGKLGR